MPIVFLKYFAVLFLPNCWTWRLAFPRPENLPFIPCWQFRTRFPEALDQKGLGARRYVANRVLCLPNTDTIKTVVVERRATYPRLPPLLSPTLSPLHPLSFAVTRNPRAYTVPGNVTHEVELKAIPKEKVKGNEENVWSEIRVPQGLDHPNIVRPVSPHPFSPAPAHARSRLSPNMLAVSL